MIIRRTQYTESTVTAFGRMAPKGRQTMWGLGSQTMCKLSSPGKQDGTATGNASRFGSAMLDQTGFSCICCFRPTAQPELALQPADQVCATEERIHQGQRAVAKACTCQHPAIHRRGLLPLRRED